MSVSTLYAVLVSAGFPEPALEVRFHPKRRWRWDMAWEEYKVALERQGATYTQGRHTRGREYSKDCEKMINGQLLGWLVLPYTVDHERSGEILAWIEAALRSRGWEGKA